MHLLQDPSSVQKYMHKTRPSSRYSQERHNGQRQARPEKVFSAQIRSLKIVLYKSKKMSMYCIPQKICEQAHDGATQSCILAYQYLHRINIRKGREGKRHGRRYRKGHTDDHHTRHLHVHAHYRYEKQTIQILHSIAHSLSLLPQKITNSKHARTLRNHRN
jgi:hypothetical protein